MRAPTTPARRLERLVAAYGKFASFARQRKTRRILKRRLPQRDLRLEADVKTAIKISADVEVEFALTRTSTASRDGRFVVRWNSRALDPGISMDHARGKCTR